jgi:hypothetical protein
MLCLIFESLEEAKIAQKKITENMKLDGITTIDWAKIDKRLDGKFCLLKPEERFLLGLENLVEEEKNENWFPKFTQT